ncbi:MAG: asparagine synthase-related protein, partial [Candidatus Nealsonbacteria bacterium]|nr:asparagine synthase-related protein [Candidatus Nealsonbacteria bacterium]
RGMFAIALFDVRKRQLWLIRDRIGIKPLYYSIHHGRLTFASEIKAILQDPQQHRAVDEEALYHYLSFLTTPAPQTLFDGIKKLEGGTWIRINEDGHIYKYRSDVPVGVFLSGGIDSSVNTALFSDGESSPVKTFSIGYEGEYRSYTNELHYARKVAQAFGAKYHEKLLTSDDLLQFLPRMVHLQDEPIADPVCFPLYFVSKLAIDNGIKVAQVGEGVDELFWGYPSWKQWLYLQKLSDRFSGNGIKRMAASLLGLNTNLRDSLRLEWLRRASVQKPIFWSGAEVFSQLQKNRLLHPRLKRKFAHYGSWEAISPIYQRFQKKAWEKSYLNWMSYVDLNFRLPELLLMRVDKMSMGVSLECRVPFVDHKFVELAMSIPETVKTKHNTLKYIFKKSVRGVVSDECINRQKQGFSVPLSEWVCGKLGDAMKKEAHEFCQETEFFDKSEVSYILSHQNKMRGWALYNFILWMRSYIMAK